MSQSVCFACNLSASAFDRVVQSQLLCDSQSSWTAARFGLREDDEVRTVDGARVTTADELRAALASAGERVALELWRDGAAHTLEGAWPSRVVVDVDVARWR